MRLPLWPQSLFGRLLAATVCAVVLAEVAALFLIAQEHERFVQQWSVREWARRVAETTLMLQPLSPAERAGAVERLLAAPPERGHWPLMPPGDPAHPPPGPPGGPERGPEPGRHSLIPLPVLTDFDRSLRDQLRAALGPGYAVEVRATPAAAADRVGRDARTEPLAERGARELRHAARAFNTMQDRLRRYLDSRTRVLAAMSHDLKTPLTRLRLQVETLENPPLEARIGRQLDEMEAMVREALALFRGVEDGEPAAPVDLNALVGKVREEFADMGGKVSVAGRAGEPLPAKPQALKRCLTNLVANAIKFGSRADIELEDGPVVAIRVRDAGPGIPDAELERVFEPFYRLESSRNRDSGGTGLGLTIARDIAQAHGGTLSLRNLAAGGLEAELLMPRAAVG